MIANRGGYWITESAEVLETFLVQTGERYRALEEALKPISVSVVDLDQDWAPRWADWWHAKTIALATLRTATRTCLQVFDREQSSQESPVALIVPATSITYTSSLRSLEKAIEEAGIQITAYTNVCQSLEEKHIRQRQRVLQALRDVERATCDAIIAARTEWDRAPRLHVRLTHVPAEMTEVQP